ncbi:hypothetical protein MUG84_00115 [Paenibacillus sp. KQZ6P-2]|uniref:Glutamyl-tRNA amidotransferase n=1 Tax=Paenibacillus mangrovi TaxID=2931978 RepID=A0A9X1WR56_9BACL|nr:hypothetical protein [Paenibacillus mangrovi]MCJ8010144.1 hypothetical protein [Paenibacillus mangrovi]
MKTLYINKKTVLKTCSLIIGLLLVFNTVYAAPGDPVGMDKLDALIQVIATWLGRIGLIVAFFGAVQLALGFKSDDADGKIRGMKTLAAGFLVWGITQSLSLFGL